MKCPECPHKLKRFHFTCLSCPIKQYTTKTDHSGYKAYNQTVFTATLPSGRRFIVHNGVASNGHLRFYLSRGAKPMIMPEHGEYYFIFIKQHPTLTPWNTFFYYVRKILIKTFGTLAERLAEL